MVYDERIGRIARIKSERIIRIKSLENAVFFTVNLTRKEREKIERKANLIDFVISLAKAFESYLRGTDEI